MSSTQRDRNQDEHDKVAMFVHTSNALNSVNLPVLQAVRTHVPTLASWAHPTWLIVLRGQKYYQ